MTSQGTNQSNSDGEIVYKTNNRFSLKQMAFFKRGGGNYYGIKRQMTYQLIAMYGLCLDPD